MAGKVSGFSAHQAHRREEVKRRCRTELQARAHGITGHAPVHSPSIDHIDFTLASVYQPALAPPRFSTPRLSAIYTLVVLVEFLMKPFLFGNFSVVICRAIVRLRFVW